MFTFLAWGGSTLGLIPIIAQPILLAAASAACPGAATEPGATGPAREAPAPDPGYRAVSRRDVHFWFQVPVDWARLPSGVPSVVEAWWKVQRGRVGPVVTD